MSGQEDPVHIPAPSPSGQLATARSPGLTTATKKHPNEVRVQDAFRRGTLTSRHAQVKSKNGGADWGGAMAAKGGARFHTNGRAGTHIIMFVGIVITFFWKVDACLNKNLNRSQRSRLQHVDRRFGQSIVFKEADQTCDDTTH